MSIIVSFTLLPVLHDLQLTSAYEVRKIILNSFFYFDWIFNNNKHLIFQYLEMRYDKRLRVFGSVIFSVYLVRSLL